MKNSGIFLAPLFSASLTAVLVLAFSIAFYFSDREHLKSENQLIVRAVAQNIQASLENRVRALKILGQSEVSDRYLSSKTLRYESFAQNLMELYPEIQAINWVAPNGVIEKRYPYKDTVAALNKDLPGHKEVFEYFQDSKTKKKAFVSHQLMTDQGVSALTVYVPIFNNQEFKGWLNGVFRIDEWIKQYLIEQKWNQVRIKIEWDSKFSEPLLLGPTEVDFILTERIQIQNQSIQFHMGFQQESDHLHILRTQSLIYFLGFFVIGLVYYLSYQKTMQKNELERMYSHLELGHVLIGSLTHDIANPLFSLSLILKKALKSDQPLSEIDKGRVLSSLQTIQDMLDVGRRIQGVRLGNSDLRTSKIDLKSATLKALELTTEMINSKNIKVHLPADLGETFVLAELKSLSHNVIPNILTNAVKFSPASSEIFIFIETDADHVHLYFEDAGPGISHTELHNTKWKVQGSQLGTDGEKGSGLGLLQVAYFMRFYGGIFSIANKDPRGVRVRLSFSKG